VPVGREVVLDSSRSRDPDGRIETHLWDLDGDGVYERDSGRKARIRHAFEQPGKLRIGLVVLDDDGAFAVRHRRIEVVREAAWREGGHSRRSGRGHGHGHARLRAATDRHEARPARKRAKAPQVHAQATPVRAAPPSTVRAAAASSTGVTIKDFEFAPKSITVSVGDTVVWTNNGPAVHTATADDGTFDTGNLAKGSTGSYRFTKAGKYSYHCSPHPFMKASVTVTGSGGSSSSNSSSSFSSSHGGSTSTSSKKDSSLPYTGFEIGAVTLAGLALLAAGAALRRRLARG
jgi:plastocyanin